MKLLTDIHGDIGFKIRYNVHNDGTGFFWRVFIVKDNIPAVMYYVNSIQCLVPSFSFGEKIEGVWHFSMAGDCKAFTIDEKYNAILK
jgi:hypothetical protein